MGRNFKKREYRHWSDPEIDALRHGKLPEGRTYPQCCMKALALGLPRPPSPTGRHKWLPEEIAELKNSKVPAGRTVSACITRGYALGLRVIDLGNGEIKVESVRSEPPSRCSMLAKAEILSKMRDEGLTYTQVADLVGVSKQYVCDMVNKFRRTTKYAKSKEKSNDRVDKLVQQFNEKHD
jgi:hypothetical protein